MAIPAHKTTIMIHCLATPKSWAVGKTINAIMADVTRWHVQDNGWAGVAYAAICNYDGRSAKGRDLDKDGDVWEETGAGARGWNTNTIHLALVGGKGGSATDKFADHYTPAQDAWLRKTIADIQSEAGRTLKVIGHNDVAAKACPCFSVAKWLASPRATTNHKPMPAQPAAPVGGLFAAIAAFFASLFKRKG